jgi:uncharacterized HAD superfamily protein
VNFRSVADLQRTITRNLHRVPRDIDVVVGIPRSGLLAANMLALALNLPLADIDSWLAGRAFASGRRGVGRTSDRPSRALVVDDSISTGRSLDAVRRQIEAVARTGSCLYCAIYTTADTRGLVDLAFEVCPQPRLFGWNYLHHPLLEMACVDIDGVLCRDPTSAENDDGPAYRNFLSAVEPMVVPTHPIGCLVTSRLERYREPTERWLAAAGVRYQALEMLDVPTAAIRRSLGNHASFKASVYRRRNALVMIESDRRQAGEIARLSGKPVVCVETQELVEPSSLSPLAWAQRVRAAPRYALLHLWRMRHRLGRR